MKKKTALLSFFHSDTKGLRHINISFFTPLGEALNLLGEMRHAEGERGGVLLQMTSVGELRLSSKPRLQSENEKRERWQTQAGITCQNRELRASEGAECKGLGFKLKPSALKHCKGDT